MICSSMFYGKYYWKLLGESVFKTKLKFIKFEYISDMFLMALCIQGSYRFADYDSHFSCIMNLSLIRFWVHYHLLILLTDSIINYY